MPTSALEVWPRLINLVATASPPPRSILDVGPGRGKAGVLLREYVGTAEWGNGPIERIDAVEAWHGYIGWLDRICDRDIGGAYDEVLLLDVRELTDEHLAEYDLVLLGDVIEHLDKPDALALLDRIPGSVVINTPAAWFQNPEADAIPPERHRSHWTLDEFHRMPRCDQAFTLQGAILARLRPKESP